MNNFAGKTALVTGGSRGIGKAICLALAQRGAQVVFSYEKNVEEAFKWREKLARVGDSESIQIVASMYESEVILCSKTNPRKNSECN